MTLAAASVTFGPEGPMLQADAPLPVEALVLGRSVAEAADFLPRLFNLCRMAQGAAARLALGLPDATDTGAEVVHDHLRKLCITLPHAFGLAALPIPARAGDLTGTGLPDRIEDLDRWDSPLAPMARHIAALFAPGQAVTAPLPQPKPLGTDACENSAPGRQAGHPLLQAVELRYGRGPLWRYVGLVADIEAALAGSLPPPRLVGDVAVVQAARGAYALRITQTGGVVTGIARRTPTDDMLAPGGPLLQALATLPPTRRHLATQVIALHDPCIPVTVSEAADA